MTLRQAIIEVLETAGQGLTFPQIVDRVRDHGDWTTAGIRYTLSMMATRRYGVYPKAGNFCSTDGRKRKLYCAINPR